MMLPSNYREALRFMATHSGPAVLVSLVIACGILARVHGGWGWPQWGLVVLVFTMRGVIEWGLHYFLWHERELPVLGVRIRNPVAKMHRMHHDNPQDAQNMLFRGRSVFVAELALFLISLIVTRHLPFSLAAVISFAAILLAYEWCHLLSHSGITPQFPPFRAIILNHRRHHFEDAEHWFGVSSTIGDRLFGTRG